MSSPVKNCICALAAVLAGCTTGPHPNVGHVPDWESEDASSNPVVSQPAPVTIPPPPAVQQPPVVTQQFKETWVPLGRWCKSRGLDAPVCVSVAPLATYSVKSTNGILMLHAHSQVATWDGLEMRLGFAPLLIDSQPFVHTLDLQKTIQPLLSGGLLGIEKTNPVIVIDPGHGGENAGTKSMAGNHFEKEYTLDWARRLASLLASNGCHVFLTRTDDSDISLSNRVAFADAHKADLFLSLHFNSAGADPSQAGLETYCLTPAGMPSTVTRGFSDDPEIAYPNNSFDAQNVQFALQVHRALLQVNGGRDRGVRRARFLGVLRGQHRPAVLIEGGYLSNPREAQLIGDPAYRQKLAEAVAAALPARSAPPDREQAIGAQKSEVPPG